MRFEPIYFEKYSSLVNRRVAISIQKNRNCCYFCEHSTTPEKISKISKPYCVSLNSFYSHAKKPYIEFAKKVKPYQNKPCYIVTN